MTLTLALVGRPNVGKSTLFNRMVGKKLAIVDDTPGVTRDWRESVGQFFDQALRIIDTAGLEEKFDDSIPGRMRKQTEEALHHTDVILFLIDGRAGITPLDEHFADYLRKQNKPVLLITNKCENENAVRSSLAESYALGLGEPISVSAEHSIGLDNIYNALLPYFDTDDASDENDKKDTEEIIENLDDIEGQIDFVFTQEEEPEEKPIKVAIVGRPNVGKSTLLNTLVDSNRVMTGPEAGITRDAIAVDWTYENHSFKLVDTAGIRRKSKITDNIEKMSVEDSHRAIRLAQVTILVLDANALLEKQDLQIAEHIIEEGRAFVIAINKWDIADDKKEILEDFKYKIEKSLAQIKDIHFVALSALTGSNVKTLMKCVMDSYNAWNTRVQTAQLNHWLARMESRNPAPLVSGRQNRLKYITQIKTRPPTFALWVSRPEKLPPSYRRYIINGLRKDYQIPGVPIRLLIRKSKNPYKK